MIRSLYCSFDTIQKVQSLDASDWRKTILHKLDSVFISSSELIEKISRIKLNDHITLEEVINEAQSLFPLSEEEAIVQDDGAFIDDEYEFIEYLEELLESFDDGIISFVQCATPELCECGAICEDVIEDKAFFNNKGIATLDINSDPEVQRFQDHLYDTTNPDECFSWRSFLAKPLPPSNSAVIIDRYLFITKEKNTLMKSLLINTNLAPVCDICKSENEFMYDRSLGQDADITADFVERFTRVSQENGISVTLKHFPGYGNNLDTHTGVAVDDRNYETFAKNDLIPFQAGIDAGAHMVLVSHNIINCMDADHPASLSLTVHEILRNDLGFTGIIVTDNLEMDAISKYFTDYSPSVAAVLAGNDMLCVSDYTQTYNDILEAISSGTIDIDLVDHAATRIIAWKMSKGLL